MEFKLPEYVKQKIAGTTCPPPLTVEQQIDRMNAVVSALPEGWHIGDSCPVCHEKGYIVYPRDGVPYTRECECMKRRRSERRLRQSGLQNLVERYTLETYKPDIGWQRDALRKAKAYIAEPNGWFVMSGQPGSGKTHLCTAIAYKFIEAGKDVVYMRWREDAPRLKALVNERDEYEREMRKYKTADVLYIDDFWKTSKGGQPTEADVNLAFELLDTRYGNKKLITILSSEKTIEQMCDIDEAVGSRIYERGKRNYIVASGNYRLKW